MDIVINYWAVLVSAVVSMVIGSLWYGKLFIKPWMELSGISSMSPEKTKEMKVAANKSYMLQLVASLVMAYVLAHFVVVVAAYDQMGGWMSGMFTGLWLWLGFVAPITLGSVMWEGKPWKLWFINTSNWLVTLLVMGAILGGWQ